MRYLLNLLPITRLLLVNDAGNERFFWTWGLSHLTRTYRAEDRAARITGDSSYTGNVRVPLRRK